MLAEELEAEFKEVDRQEFHQVVAIAQQLDTSRAAAEAAYYASPEPAAADYDY